MKILFIDTYYSEFLKQFYKKHSGLKSATYKKLKEKLLNTYFGTSNFFSDNLRQLGHNADDLVVNDELLQRKWAKEQNFSLKDNWLISKFQMFPFIYRVIGKPQWIQQIVLEQIKRYKPGVVYVQDLSILNPETLEETKQFCKLLVGQIACPLPPEKNTKKFDLIITSFPHYASLFRKMKIKSEYQKLAFEPRVLKRVGKLKKVYDVTFIGSFTPYHQKGTRILEEVAKHIPIHVWGQGMKFLSPLSPLRKNYHGEAWGVDMYKTLAQSKIVINRHIDVSGEYANNMRLYETTGMGAMLITDYKKNLNDLFKIGKEVVAYKNKEDLIRKVKYYLKHDEEREKIALAGQKRTLRDHNYLKRMKELTHILQKYL